MLVNPNNSSNGKAQKHFINPQNIKQHEIIHQFLVTSLIQFNNKFVHCWDYTFKNPVKIVQLINKTILISFKDMNVVCLMLIVHRYFYIRLSACVRRLIIWSLVPEKGLPLSISSCTSWSSVACAGLKHGLLSIIF